MSYSNREVELFQLWAKRAEVERIISLHKTRLSVINQQVKKIARLVNIDKQEKRGLQNDKD